MCYNGFEPGDTEGEREAAQPYETEGDLPFIAGDPDDWRHGFPMGPEEEAFRKLIEDDDPEDGA